MISLLSGSWDNSFLFTICKYALHSIATTHSVTLKLHLVLHGHLVVCTSCSTQIRRRNSAPKPEAKVICFAPAKESYEQ